MLFWVSLRTQWSFEVTPTNTSVQGCLENSVTDTRRQRCINNNNVEQTYVPWITCWRRKERVFGFCVFFLKLPSFTHHHWLVFKIDGRDDRWNMDTRSIIGSSCCWRHNNWQDWICKAVLTAHTFSRCCHFKNCSRFSIVFQGCCSLSHYDWTTADNYHCDLQNSLKNIEKKADLPYSFSKETLQNSSLDFSKESLERTSWTTSSADKSIDISGVAPLFSCIFRLMLQLCVWSMIIDYWLTWEMRAETWVLTVLSSNL